MRLAQATVVGQSVSVGMFDTYEPRDAVACATCGAEIGVWQGTDGPCALFLWRQGERHPVDQPVDADARIATERYGEFELPAAFGITGYCAARHRNHCQGKCVEGVWTVTEPPTMTARDPHG